MRKNSMHPAENFGTRESRRKRAATNKNGSMINKKGNMINNKGFLCELCGQDTTLCKC